MDILEILNIEDKDMSLYEELFWNIEVILKTDIDVGYLSQFRLDIFQYTLLKINDVTFPVLDAYYNAFTLFKTQIKKYENFN